MRIKEKELESLGFGESNSGYGAQSVWIETLNKGAISCLYEESNDTLRVWDKNKKPQLQIKEENPSYDWIKENVIDKYK